MRTGKVFNTKFEISLRLLLLLAKADKPVDLEFIHVVDFVATYAKAFSIADENVNGDNQFMFGEHPARYRRDEEALRELVLEGHVQPIASGSGMLYVLTERGKAYSASLDSDYARRYSFACEKAIEYAESKTLKAIVEEIHRLEKRPLRGVV